MYKDWVKLPIEFDKCNKYTNDINDHGCHINFSSGVKCSITWKNNIITYILWELQCFSAKSEIILKCLNVLGHRSINIYKDMLNFSIGLDVVCVMGHWTEPLVYLFSFKPLPTVLDAVTSWGNW